ncbi:MAG: hypothetical protein HOW73_34870 [Polyangiaceae bacterium]|nr:hypothetical protein [Polyangiaceae bacterium]
MTTIALALGLAALGCKDSVGSDSDGAGGSDEGGSDAGGYGSGGSPSTSNASGGEATTGSSNPTTTTSMGSGGEGGSSSGSGGAGPTSCPNDVENIAALGSGAAVTAYPACIGFATDAYDTQYNLVWLNQGATHEYVPNGGWNGGGAARFTPPHPSQAATGLGQLHLDTTPPSHLSMRWLMKAGPTMGQYAYGNKTTIFVQTESNATHPRPMIITRPNPAVPNSFVPAPCDGTVCQYHGTPQDEPWWPDGSDTFWIGGAGGYQEQWVSWEFESDLSEGWIRLYLTTEDGAFNDTLYVQNDLIDGQSVTGGTFAYIDFVGGYFMDGVTPDPGNWFEIDEIVVSDQHIGPPAGFVR